MCQGLGLENSHPEVRRTFFSNQVVKKSGATGISFSTKMSVYSALENVSDKSFWTWYPCFFSPRYLRNPNLPPKNLNTGPTFSSCAISKRSRWDLFGVKTTYIQIGQLVLEISQHKKVGPVFEVFDGRFGYQKIFLKLFQVHCVLPINI